MVSRTGDKMLWMNENLKAVWEKDQPKDYLWVLDAAASATQFAVGHISPSSVPKGVLNRVGKALSGKAAELIPGGHGLFDQGDLCLTKAEEKKLKNEEALFKAIGQSTFLFLWAAVGTTVPILGGIVLITAGLKYLIKSEKIDSERRWEEIMSSMMTKYEAILQNAELQKAKKEADAVAFIVGVESVRFEEFKLERRQGSATLAKAKIPGTDKTIRLTPDAVLRLIIYLESYLNFKVDHGEFEDEVLAEVYALIYQDVNAYSDNSLAFENDPAHNVNFSKQQSTMVEETINKTDRAPQVGEIKFKMGRKGVM